MTMLGRKRKSKNGTEATNEIRGREPSGTVSSNTTSSKSRSSGHQEQDNRDVDMSHQVDHLVENTVMAWQQSSTNSYESRQHMEQLVLRSFFEKLQEIYRLTPSFTSSPSSSSSPNPSQGTPLLKLLVKSNSMAFPISAIEATTLKHNSYSSKSSSSSSSYWLIWVVRAHLLLPTHLGGPVVHWLQLQQQHPGACQVVRVHWA